MFRTLNKPLVRQYVIVVIVNLSLICTGMSLSWPSPVLVKLRNDTQQILPEPLTEEQGSWVVSIGFLVAIFANFLSAPLIDILGRKYTVIFACCFRLIMSLLFIFANSFWMLLLGRGISGISDSINMAVTSVYASEIASKGIRGSLGTFLQIFSSIGILIMLSMGPFISYLNLNIVLAGATIITTIPILLIPESPYFMYSKGRTEDTLKALIFLRGSTELAKEEMKEYSASFEEVKVSKGDLFKNRTFLKTFGIVIILGIGSQAVGFNMISFYLQTILESTQTNIGDRFGSVVVGCIQLTASFMTAIILDKFGRKPILGVMMGLMTVGMFGLGTFFFIRDSSDSNTVSGVMNFVPLISLIFVVFGYSAGPGCIFWLLIAELFEGPARAIGMSCFIITATLTIFLTTRFFVALTTSLTPAGTYWLFGSICVLFNAFLLIFIPETKDKSFAEIQVALGAKERVKEEVNNGSNAGPVT